MCGEKLGDFNTETGEMGSPPHVRGKEYVNRPPRVHLGITPACAGKRGRNKSGQPAAKDHPRMCGEKTKKIP